MSEFNQPTAKLTIASIDEPGIRVPAQYNPKELEISQAVPWKKPDAANQTGTQKGSGAAAGDDPIALEFTGAEGRTMTVELLFDGYEEGGGGRIVDVAGQVALLEQLARVRNPKSADENLRRPHQCMVSWGAALPSFQCVIESLTTKYTMFSSEGAPLRATCTVKLKEAHAVGKKAGK
jgi:hypothetical protein